MSDPAARPLYETIADALAERIARGDPASGERLPSVRALMRLHRVGLATAARALVELEARGLAEARPRSGFFVTKVAARPDDAPRPTATAATPRPVEIDRLIATLFRAAADRPVVALGAAEIDVDLLPRAELAAATARVVRREGGRAIGYAPADGDPDLRRAVARRMNARGCDVAASDVVITAGESDAMGLALRALTRPGDTVAIESPTYFGILQWLEAAGLEAVEIATDPVEGIDVAALDRVAAERPLAAVVLNPTFHNPFGSAMPPERMAALIEVARRRDLAIVEDDVYGELHFGARRRPLESFDPDGRVIYCSSFSKTLVPGFRIGWCLPGRHAEAFARARPARNFGQPALTQMVLAEYLIGRRHDRHLDALRALFRAQRERIRELVLTHFPPGTRISRPEGGYVYWIEVPPPFAALALHAAAAREGISIAPGPLFSPSGRFEGAFRLSLGRRLDARVEAAIRRLGRLATEAATDHSS